MIYFAPKLWLYVMIWLPQTTDNSHILLCPLKFEVSRVDCILNLKQRLRCHLKIFLFLALVAILFSGAKPLVQFW